MFGVGVKFTFIHPRQAHRVPDAALAYLMIAAYARLCHEH